MFIPSNSKVLCPNGYLFAVRRSVLLLTLLSLLTAMSARATITVLDYWRMGEADSGAVAGGTPVNATDSVGSHTLKYSGTAHYSSDVSPTAQAQTGSSLSVNFTNSAFASNTIVSTVQNNFGLEAWVKPVSTSGNPVIVYNGSTGSSGWGLMITNGTYQGLFGGITDVGSGTVNLNQWVHLAMVRNNGVTVLYTNGVAAGASVSSTPNVPAGNFEIGAQTVGAGSRFFTGSVDEVRVFTFAAGQFSTNDLLMNLSPAIALGTTNLCVGTGAGSNSVFLAASTNALWTVSANATWLHPAISAGSGITNVIFNYDANAGGTRTGTLTISGQTLTITQAGTSYVAAVVYTNLATGLNYPQAVAADGAGNVYFADTANNAIKKWNPTNKPPVTTLVSGLNSPAGVAVDHSGNVYFSDTYNNALKRWNAANGTVSNIISSGLLEPSGLAIDSAGNVYIADYGYSYIREWVVATGTVSNLVTSGLSNPTGVAVDAAGNVYIADTVHNDIKERFAASGAVSNLPISGLSYPKDVAVDGSGNIYIADDSGPGVVKKWTATTGTVATLPMSVYGPYGLFVDGNENLYIADSGNNIVTEQQFAYVNTSPRVESSAAGFDNVPVVLPASDDLAGPFAPFVDSSWLSVTGAVSGVVGYSFASNTLPNLLGRTGHLNILGQSIAITQAPPSSYVPGTTNLLLGPGTCSNSIYLAVAPASADWTNDSVASWLHLNPATIIGNGTTNVLFSCDANPSSTTRTGTLFVANQSVTITQAGSNYVAATLMTNIVTGLNVPAGVAVDAAGNVYFADSYNNAIKKWTLTNNSVNSLVPSGQSLADGVVLDGAGDVFFTAFGAISEWSAANSNVTTIASYTSTPGFSPHPEELARDSAGNLYTVDGIANTLEMWSPVNSNVTTFVSSGLSGPYGLAVDAVGANIFIADTGHNAVKQWQALSGNVSGVVSNGLNSPVAVALDGSGNIYIADQINQAIEEWIAVSNTVVTLGSASGPNGVTVDPAGNVYLSDENKNAILEIPHAFVATSPISEPGVAGNDSLPVVLPASANLSGTFAPFSDSPWLIITGVTNGVVSFSFAANTPLYARPRTGHITLLGRSIAITQSSLPYQVVGTTNILVGPPAGISSVALEVAPPAATWTASTTYPWLHLTPANQSGAGCTNIIFSYDANSSATRAGTLSIAGQTVTITQAGSNYVSAGQFTTLASGQGYVDGVAVDGSGNVFFDNTTSNAITEWIMASNTLASVVSSGLNNPEGIAVDSAGNLYISDTYNSSLKKWLAASHSVVTLANFSSSFRGLSLDAVGDIYMADSYNNVIWEWQALNSNVVVKVSGLNTSSGVASDFAGDNLYIADLGNQNIKQWSANGGVLSTLVSSGVKNPFGVAVDGLGNVYIANTSDNLVNEWIAATGTVTNLLSGSDGISEPDSVAVDAKGNLYIADTFNRAIEELSYAFVSSNAVMESSSAGNDALPPVLPVTENLLPPFAPTAYASWLTITGITNGCVGFSFAANTNAIARTGYIVVLGQVVPVIQAAVNPATPPVLTTVQLTGNGTMQFSFTNSSTATFTVWSTTNLSLPFNKWTIAGAASNLGSGLFQFTSPPATNTPGLFYRVTSP